MLTVLMRLMVLLSLSSTCTLGLNAAWEPPELVQHSRSKVDLIPLPKDILNHLDFNATVQHLIIKLDPSASNTGFRLNFSHNKLLLTGTKLKMVSLSGDLNNCKQTQVFGGKTAEKSRTLQPSHKRRWVRATDVNMSEGDVGVGSVQVSRVKKPETQTPRNESVLNSSVSTGESTDFFQSNFDPGVDVRDLFNSVFNRNGSRAVGANFSKGHVNEFDGITKLREQKRKSRSLFEDTNSATLKLVSEKVVAQQTEELRNSKAKRERTEDSLLQRALHSNEFAQFSKYIETLPNFRQEEIFWWLHDHYFDSEKHLSLTPEVDEIARSSKVSQDIRKNSDKEKEIVYFYDGNLKQESQLLVKRLFEEDKSRDDSEQRRERFLFDDVRDDDTETHYFDADEFGLVNRDIEELDLDAVNDKEDQKQQQQVVDFETDLNVDKYSRRETGNDSTQFLQTPLPSRHIASHSAVAEALRNNGGRFSLVATGIGNGSSQMTPGDLKYAQVLRLLTESRRKVKDDVEHRVKS